MTRRPFLSISRVRLLGPFVVSALLLCLVPFLHVPWDRHDARWTLAFVATLALSFAVFRCPRCWAGVALRRGEFRIRCRKCGLDLERNTYWGRPFVSGDTRWT